MATSQSSSAGKVERGSDQLKLECKILEYLKKNLDGQKTLEISKAVGYKTKKDVNSTLYGLEKKNLICKEGDPPFIWKLKKTVSDVSESATSSHIGADLRPPWKWIKSSERWSEKLDVLRNTPIADLVSGLTQIRVCTKDLFHIADGCDGTSVYVGLLVDGREVAVKRVLKKHNKRLEKEVENLAKLKHHDNIVSYKLKEWPEGDFGYIAIELCDDTLKCWQHNQPEVGWDKVAVDLVKDLLEGLQHIHRHKLLHRDLKPENLLMVTCKGKDKDKVTLKLADFGISQQLEKDKDSYHSGPAGTRCWQAREVLESHANNKLHPEMQPEPRPNVRYTASVDVQVAGMLIYYILTKGKHPFAPDDKYDKLKIGSAIHTCGHMRRRYDFLADFGNEPEIANSESEQHKACSVRKAIEKTKAVVLSNGKDWKDLSVIPLLTHQKPFKTPAFMESVCKLLRTMRNISEHYDEQSAEAKQELGHNPKPFEYFDKNFPLLMTTVYDVVKTACCCCKADSEDWKQRKKLKAYFSEPA
ncbi:Serine/threonine-protein kinase/endoribonuclease IRE1 [Lamellibrachia satsuma]|nr:Serine/threonine-protein kinase/endoribonuclease IRE1 [Lamellibrachia satsuma]